MTGSQSSLQPPTFIENPKPKAVPQTLYNIRNTCNQNRNIKIYAHNILHKKFKNKNVLRNCLTLVDTLTTVIHFGR